MKPPARPAPFPLRLKPEVRAELERGAAAVGMALGPYILWRATDPNSPPPKGRGKTPVKDHQALSAVLAKLGQSRIANNLNQLARAVNSGSLVLTPDLIVVLHEAGGDIAAIRDSLVKALGKSDAP